MVKRVCGLFALAVGLALTAGEEVRAADPTLTTISIPDMHCAGCAKKVTAEIAKTTGVAKAEADMKAKTITVTPKAGAVLSPKAVWEAVERADQEPKKLEGPSGTFTAKPKS